MSWRAELTSISSSLLLLAPPFAFAAEKPAWLAVGVGAFGVRDQTAVSPMASLQCYTVYRLFEQTAAARFQGIGPILGFSANTDGGVFGYREAFAALRVLDRIHLLRLCTGP